MGLRSWLFGPEKKNSLVVLEESNSQLRQLLALEQKNCSDLMQQLKTLQDALLNVEHGFQAGNETTPEATPEVNMEATPKEKEILAFVSQRKRATAKEVQEALHYKHRATASKMVSALVKKRLLKRLNSGKYSAYVLPGSNTE